MKSKSKTYFKPFGECVEVEPIRSYGPLADDNPKLLEMATALSDFEPYNIHKGDIMFFRPHGFFELPEYQGKKRYVLKVGNEFVLGVLHHGTLAKL